MALAMTPAQQAACEVALTLRAWHPPLLLAGDVSDAEAVSLLREHLHWQQAVVTSTRLDAQAAQTKDALWAAVRDFNLGQLYGVLPDTHDEWRTFTLAGQLRPAHYRVAAIAPGAFDKPLDALGDTTAEFAMRTRPVPRDGPGGDRYTLRARLRADIGAIQWPDVLRTTWAGLDQLTTTAALPTPGGGGFFGGTGSDAEILAQLQPGFANFFRWYLGIAEIPDILAADSARAPAQHLRLVVQIDDGLREHYPAVADYLAQIKGFISAHVAIENEAGRWLSVDLDSVAQRLTLDGWVHNGHLVPVRGGEPRIEVVDTSAPLNRLSYRSVADVQLKALGVRVDLNQWPIDWRYRRTARGADYAARITQPPQIEVGGAALGFIPTGLVDIAIPNNIEGIVNDFMQVLVESDDGKGATLGVAFENGTRRDSIVAAYAEGDTLDNFFVQFAVSLVNERILPNHDQFQGLQRLAGDALTALLVDTDHLLSAQKKAGEAGLSDIALQCRTRAD